MIRSGNSRSSNAAAAIGAILDRFRLTTGAAAESAEDHELRVAAWVEVLGVAEIPVERYEELYHRALKTRTERRAAGLEVFYLKPDDLIAEYRALAKPVVSKIGPGNCPERHNHRSADEALQDYGFPGEAEEWLPCHVCRPTAFRRRKAEVSDARAERERQAKTRSRVYELMAGRREDDPGNTEL